MKFEAVTIKDIAAALGLSTSTVSKALRDSYEISEETKKLVQDYAKKINYRPNLIAVSLREKRTRTLGLVVSDLSNNFFLQVIDGIESAAQVKGYNLIIAQSKDDYEREQLNLQFLTSRGIDGLLVSVSAESNDHEYLKSLHEGGMPMVLFDRVAPGIDTHTV